MQAATFRHITFNAKLLCYKVRRGTLQTWTINLHRAINSWRRCSTGMWCKLAASAHKPAEACASFTYMNWTIPGFSSWPTARWQTAQSSIYASAILERAGRPGHCAQASIDRLAIGIRSSLAGTGRRRPHVCCELKPDVVQYSRSTHRFIAVSCRFRHVGYYVVVQEVLAKLQWYVIPIVQFTKLADKLYFTATKQTKQTEGQSNVAKAALNASNDLHWSKFPNFLFPYP